MNRQRIKKGLTRRDLLKQGLAGAVSLHCSRLWANPPAVPKARAQSVIQIWMWGGPSHLDTFDPKPEAGYDYCGPLNQPIPTNVDGIQISQLLPLLAKQADKYAIIRSMTHGNNNHETASYLVQTGREPGRLVYPSVGAVVSLFKGYDHGYTGIVPPYIVLTESQGRFSEAGFLGQRYKPFVTGGDPNQTPFAVEGIVAKGISDQRQQNRRQFLHSLDVLGKLMPDDPQFARLDQCEQNAYAIMFGPARRLFDLSEEKEEVRQRYGRNTFGQCCLMARRLVEQGVPYVTINYKGWDTHKQHFDIMRRKLPELDMGMSALLQDLADKGLLDTTIVWWGGEFGRTPKIQWEAPWNGGRGHYGKSFCSVVAGGGFKGGCVVGASDEKGLQPAQRPVYPQDLIGSIYLLLGINPDGPLPNAGGLDVKVMPESSEGGRLREIM
ncbi:MAG TPA: DUF1501 domain-containing protein [Anaerohalosphaeraceae bacterium]|nr:DUF1501 domain-containing protein [Anaerohalosphaeraceae bacterium]HOL30567.1 DUF1501 domain-containing protein [Anaerohalosphaeraceae bacterium]HOM75051.1 DUF1501 domain-containing protein [Anaerohalosphaeraceae bacterium]HPC63612.1 DUF1501 domain-containing protein [Anaerohalosphaeraceae bacterium]HPO68866.1 DUF1501 domain-containing protein [Anaerohalosphaeraceae bacterium]